MELSIKLVENEIRRFLAARETRGTLHHGALGRLTLGTSI